MKQIRLALSGSGFLAPIHAGAICAFLDVGVEIIEVAGTSGGSIAAALLAAGKTSLQIKAAAMAELPDNILEFQPLALASQGFNHGDSLLTWLDDTLGSATFAGAKMPVSIMATDINSARGFKFSRQTTPDISLASACRASASVPFVFVPAHLEGKKLVDGGLVCNIPVDELIQDDVPRIGIEVIDGSPAGTTETFIGLAEQCLSTLMFSGEQDLIAWGKQTGARILPVSADPYGFLNAKLKPTEKEDLFQRGYFAVKAIL
jgi:NTE family protein